MATDLSVSRSSERAHGWGISVPGDPRQVIYVWIDALANYVSAPGPDRWESFHRITHVVGKGVLRFHAVYWPALLLSAGLRPPTDIFVHNYVTVEGQKIGKSLGNTISPIDPIRELGLDAFRYYLIRHIGCFKDGDFSWKHYRKIYEQELANKLGNLVSRLTTLLRRHSELPLPKEILGNLSTRVRDHVERFALHRVMDESWQAIEDLNATISHEEPWKLDTEPQSHILSTAADGLTKIASELAPFLPNTSASIMTALAGGQQTQLFPRASW